MNPGLPALPKAVTVVEVGARDGLQNEPVAVATAEKVAFVNLLAASGVPVVEVTAFVSPRWVPQMGDAAEVCQAIERRQGTRYSALVPNVKGLERALSAGVREVAIVAAASETFSRRNVNQGVDDSLRTCAEVCREATAAGARVRGYLSTAFGCPFEGPVAPGRVAEIAGRLADLGVFEVSVSDTIGVAHPGQVAAVVDAVAARTGLARVALHFHDTRGTALANVLAGLSAGVTTFDASAGGLGGCPYAPGATGNLATEDLVYMLDGLGISTGIALPRLIEASRFIEAQIGHALPSRCYQAAKASRIATRG